MGMVGKLIELFPTVGWKSNQVIKFKSSYFKLDNARSGYPVSRARGSCIMRSSIPGRIGI